jgi:hypothetical protein
MPLYFSAHTTACLTKQALRELMKGLLEAAGVNIRRSVASQIGGRMLVEAEAPDQKTLEKFFESRNINCEWVMRIDLDARNGEVSEH